MVDGSGVINLSSLKSENIASNFVSCNGDYCYPSCSPEILEANIITCTMMGTMEYFSFTPVSAFTYKDLDGLAVNKELERAKKLVSSERQNLNLMHILLKMFRSQCVVSESEYAIFSVEIRL